MLACSTSRSQMALSGSSGGRSTEEGVSKASKKSMFKGMRDKFNSAARLPGFFEVGEGAPVSERERGWDESQIRCAGQ